MTKKLKAVFMGNPEFSLPSLEALYNHSEINLIAVVGSPDKPVGRGKKIQSPATIDYAKKNNIKIFQADNINKETEFFDFLESEKPDFILVLAFSHFLNEKILKAAKYGCFNIHTSILPKYRGSSPIHYALLNNDPSTGVSIQRMVKKMDAGDLCHFNEISISAEDNYISLSSKLSVEAGNSTKAFLDKLSSEKLEFTIQNEEEVTFAPLIKKEEGQVNFLENTAYEIHHKVRAFALWPGVYFFNEGKRYKIHETKISNESIPSGKVDLKHGKILIGTLEKTLEIITIQSEGKPKQKAIDFINGLGNKSFKIG